MFTNTQFSGDGMSDSLVEIIGWAGACMILLAYFLVSTGRAKSDSKLYQWLNVFGAIGFVINGLSNKAYPVAGLNVVWCLIGIVTLVKIHSGRMKKSARE